MTIAHFLHIIQAASIICSIIFDFATYEYWYTNHALSTNTCNPRWPSKWEEAAFVEQG